MKKLILVLACAGLFVGCKNQNQGSRGGSEDMSGTTGYRSTTESTSQSDRYNNNNNSSSSGTSTDSSSGRSSTDSNTSRPSSNP